MGCEARIYSESHLFELPYVHRVTRYNLGGVPFYFLYKDLPTFNLHRMLSDVGVGFTFSISMLVSFLLLTQLRLTLVIAAIKQKYTRLKTENQSAVTAQEEASFAAVEKNTKSDACALAPLYPSVKAKALKDPSVTIRTMVDHYPEENLEKEEKTASTKAVKTATHKRQAALDAQNRVNGDYTSYQLPPASLLNQPKKGEHPSLKKELKRQAEILEETLLSFGIEAKVGQINCGPTITSFEVHPAIGVKVQKIKTLENDIALNLEAKSIRIIAPIPGKAAVGVEIPSLYPQEVSFKELLLHYQQNPRKMMIPLLLGKAVLGDNVISDMSKMPHCLIAGATGSGKSVCVNTIIMSILMNARPDEIKLIMIDPKKSRTFGLF